MNKPSPVYAGSLWPYVATLLPDDMEEIARTTGALVRCRNVERAEALMRIVLAYAVSDLSMKDVAAWARAEGVADITGPGLFYRLRMAENWLAEVLARTLEAETGTPPPQLPLRFVDATVLCGPGSTGTDWRAHVAVNHETGNFRAVEITDAHGGEGYGRYNVQPGEIIVGDRAYATATGIAAVQAAGAYVLARLNPYTIRLCDTNQQVIKLLERTDQIPLTGAISFDITVPIPPVRTKSNKTWSLAKASGWLSARVVAARTRTGQPIWIITTVPTDVMSNAQVAQVYRLRWQIELAFKRLKSLLHLDTLPTRAGPTAKSWMLARLLAAALAQRLVPLEGPLSPWGYVIKGETPNA